MGQAIYTKAEREKMESHALVKHGSLPWLSRFETATKALAEIRDAASAKQVMDIAVAAAMSSALKSPDSLR